MDEKELLWIETLQDLLKDEVKLFNYGKAGLIRAEDFRLEAIMVEWKSLISNSFESESEECKC